MKARVTKDSKYKDIYDISTKHWYGWRYRYFVTANSLEDAKEKAKELINPPSLTWEV